MILHVHHRYRTLGGEERAIAGLRRVTEERLGEPTALLERDSGSTGAARAAAGLLRGGLHPGEVAAEVARTGARLVHVHNVHPTFGSRALRAARAAGAVVVLQLHNYRAVCAVATCVRDGQDCTACHGRDTRPGVRHGCRGGGAEALAYAAGIARQQRPLLDACDLVVVPSGAALGRLRALGLDLPEDRVRVVPHPVHAEAGPGIGTGRGDAGGDGRQGIDAAAGPDDAPGTDGTRTPDPAGPALVVGRLAPEKGARQAIEAARRTGRDLVVVGSGPLEAELRAAAADLPHVRFAGRLDPADLAALRAGASVELVPSLAHETFGLAAAEAMLAGLPVVASNVGALRELVPDDARVPPGDVGALAAAWERLAGDAAAGARQAEAARRLTAPDVVAERLAGAYRAAADRAGRPSDAPGAAEDRAATRAS